MKITAIELRRLRVPLRTPFRTALRSVDEVDDIVVMMRADNGAIGHGSAPPTAAITGETHATIIAAIRDHIAPRLIGVEVAQRNHLGTLIDTALPGNGSAKAAVDIALHDLWGQLHQAPLYQLFGGGTPRLETSLTISLGSVETMVEEARRALARGFSALKIKVGKQVDADIERVCAIDRVVAGRAALRLDANQGWTAAQTVQVLQALERAGVQIDLIEQPVPAADIEGMCHIAERVQVPLMADESAFDARAALSLIERRAARIINVKLMKAGGIGHAVRIIDIAALHGIECMLGCMLESAIAVTAAAHLAIAHARTVTRIDLDAPSLCSLDPIDGSARFDGPRIEIGDGPGLGIRTIAGLEEIA